MGAILEKIIGEGVGAAIPGGKLYYKTLTASTSFINSVIKRKKDKAAQKIEDARARYAQLNSLDFQGLQNPGSVSSQNVTPVQAAIFGQPISGKSKPALQLVPFEQLDKDGKTKTNTMDGMNWMDWAKKYWYYLAAGVAAYYLLKKKRR